ncbi:MAG: YihA family ribosome biogenesis GTP-binding protein [Chlorobiota bacterium]|jgi:GTP-binding protein|nr:MAG: YihA family ribosome biogenesis GTP-binding protein [Chlorobiota bacterium]
MHTPRVAFLRSIVRLEELPDYPFPEVAFAGRSNVGKSSLLNALVLQRRLARTSATPGQTRSINLYPVNGEWVLVDLPGYGYARVSHEQRDEFRRLVMGYLLERKQLALACVLVDARRDPSNDDLALLEELELHQRRFAVILTKADTVAPVALKERLEQIRALVEHCSACQDVLATSARTKLGRTQLWALIQNVLNHHRTQRTSSA